MSIAATADIVHLWTESTTPVRLGWRGQRYRVLTASPLRSAIARDSLTNPAERLTGWHLVVHPEDDSGDRLVIDVQRSGSGWVLAGASPA